MNDLILKYRENKFDYVFDSQKVFEKIMFAMSFPGKIFELPGIKLTSDLPESNSLLLCALTLLDIETNFNVNSNNEKKTNSIKNYLGINTNSKFENLENADFIFTLDELGNDFNKIKRGTYANPHKSSTVFYLVEEMNDHPSSHGTCIGLTGPGIKEENIISVNKVHVEEIKNWTDNCKDYPLGADILLVTHDGRICGIPRTSKVSLRGVE